jgi:hypothetical protein
MEIDEAPANIPENVEVRVGRQQDTPFEDIDTKSKLDTLVHPTQQIVQPRHGKQYSKMQF